MNRVGAQLDHAEQTAGDERGVGAAHSLAGVRDQEVGLPQRFHEGVGKWTGC